MTKLTPLALAFVGDAYHTLFVREKVLQKNSTQKNYHLLASKYCNARSQKLALEKISPSLTADELEVVKSARNAHAKHKAKNYTEEEYKKATAFEALVGYLYIEKRQGRILELFQIVYQGEIL